LLITETLACKLYVSLRCPISPPEKKQEICPISSLTEDINHQSSDLNNGKVKIACNSDYIQTEILNFTFAWETIIVYCYICSNHRCSYCCNVI